jgi:hypothetical protein
LAVYQQTDPETGDKLGRAPAGWKRFREIFTRKLAAEPYATWERRLELEREAGQEARRSPLCTDLTVAHSKSISVLHASFREQARRARLAGDTAREALWRAREERVQEILQEANHAALQELQRRAGFVRTGYHGRRVGPSGMAVTVQRGAAGTRRKLQRMRPIVDVGLGGEHLPIWPITATWERLRCTSIPT